jgi:hypothetical protein
MPPSLPVSAPFCSGIVWILVTICSKDQEANRSTEGSAYPHRHPSRKIMAIVSPERVYMFIIFFQLDSLSLETNIPRPGEYLLQIITQPTPISFLFALWL